MSRRKNRHQHTADTRQWSANKAARELIEQRDLTLKFGRSNPAVAMMAAQDLQNALIRYAEAADRVGSANPLAEALQWTGRAHLIGKPLTEEVLQQESVRYAAGCLRDLEAADLHIISPAMHTTAVAAACTLTDEESLMFRADDLPTRDGVLLLPTHMIVDPGGDTVPQDFIALSWHQQVITGRSGKPVEVIAVRSWLDTHGPIQVEGFLAAVRMMRRDGMHMPPWLMLGDTRITLQHDGEDEAPEIDDITREMLNVSLVDRKSDLIGLGDVSAEYDGESSITGHSLNTWPQKYLLAFFRLANQNIATIADFREGIDPRAKYQQHHDTRVVQLRSYSVSATEAGGGHDDDSKRRYTHQFAVRMHKVNQWYPKANTHKLIWRGPFIKGPKDAPMMEGIKVNALTR